MQNYYDISIGDISIVIKKEKKPNVYRCKSRNKDGFIFVTGLGTFEMRRMQPASKNSLLILSKGGSIVYWLPMMNLSTLPLPLTFLRIMHLILLDYQH